MKTFLLLAAATLFASSASAQMSGAMVRVVHASPDAPAVNVLVNGNVAFEGLPYKGYTAYTNLPAGTYTVALQVAPSGPTVYSTTFTIANGLSYTFVAMGRVAGGANPLNIFGFADDLTAPAMGQSRLRVIHAAPGAPAVDVFATAPFTPLMGAMPWLRNVPFAGVSGYLQVPAGSYQARVTVAGTRTVAIDSGNIQLPANVTRTVLALDPAMEGGRFELFFLPDVN